MEPDQNTHEEAAEALKNAVGTGVVPDQKFEDVVERLPGEVVLELAHLAKFHDGFVFSGSADDAKVYHVLKKHRQTTAIYEALLLFEEAIAKDARERFPDPVDKETAKRDDPTVRQQAGFNFVPQRVVLKERLGWEDLVAIRKSRAAYLGRRFGNEYETKIVTPNVTRAAGDPGFLKLADSVRLTDEGIEIVDSLGRRTYKSKHDLAKNAGRLAETFKERNIDPTHLETEELCYKNIETRRNHAPEDILPKPAAKPAPVRVEAAPQVPVIVDAVPPPMDADYYEPDASEVAAMLDETMAGSAPVEAAPVPESPAPPAQDAGDLSFEFPDRLADVPVANLVFGAERLTDQQIDNVLVCLRAIADNDSRRKVGETIGFNREDTIVGHKLAGLETLSPLEASLARLFVIRYGSRQFHSENFATFRIDISNKVFAAQKTLRTVAADSPAWWQPAKAKEPAALKLEDEVPGTSAASVAAEVARPAPTSEISESPAAPAEGPTEVQAATEAPAPAPAVQPEETLAHFAPAIGELKCTKLHRMIKVDGETFFVSDAEYAALRQLSEKHVVKVTSLEHTPSRVTNVLSVSIDEQPIDFRALIEQTARESGVVQPVVQVTQEAIERLETAVNGVMVVPPPSITPEPPVPTAEAPAPVAEAPEAPTSEVEPSPAPAPTFEEPASEVRAAATLEPQLQIILGDTPLPRHTRKDRRALGSMDI